MRIASDGNVGIGTTNPNTKLQVSGSVSIGGYNAVYSGTNVSSLNITAISYPVLAFYYGTTLAGTTTANSLGLTLNAPASKYISFEPGDSEKMRITSAGNVGIGTTSPSQKLTINNGSSTGAGAVYPIRLSGGTMTSVGDSTGLLFIQRDANDDYGAYIRLYTTQANPQYLNPRLEFGVQTTDTNILGSVVTRMVITGDGDVGIGTTSPTAQSNYRFLQVNGTNSAVIETMVGGTRIGGFDSSASALYVGSIGSYPVIFRTAVNEKMRIATDGNVGIGTTSPDTLLHVHGSSPFVRISNSASANHGIKITYGSSETHGLHLLYQPGSALSFVDNTYPVSAGYVFGDIYFRQNVAGTMTTRMTIKADGGLVGIGMTPNTGQGKLQINQPLSSSINGALRLTDNATTSFVFNNIASGLSALWSSGQLAFGTNNNTFTERVRIDTNGNLGIGSSSPGAKLDIVGGINSSTANNFNISSGPYNAVFYNYSTSTSDYNAIRIYQGSVGSAVGYFGTGGSATGNVSFRNTFVVGTQSGNDFVLNTTDTERVRITSGGNVGIGTSSPAAFLNIVGNGIHTILRNTSATSYTSLRLYNDQNSAVRALEIDYSGASYSGALITSGPTGESACVTTTGAYPLAFGTNNTARMTILSGGNVGIGTNAPASKLHISGSGQTIMRLDGSTTTSVSQFQIKAASDAVLIMGMYGGSGASTNFGVTAAGQAYFGTTTLGTTHPTSLVIGTASPIPTIFSTNNTEKMRIISTGEVGIGTTSPNSRFEVVGSTFNRATFKSTANVQTGIQIQRTGGVSNTDWELYAPASSTDLRLYNGTDLITFQTTGNVGIGTSSPVTKLDVVGSTRLGLNLSSTHVITGSLNVGGGTFNNAISIDRMDYYQLQPYIEGGSIPENVLQRGGGTTPTFTTLTGSLCPFGKVAYNTSYYEAIGDFIPVNPGETLYGEIWGYRSSGATGTGGGLYVGIARYDKDKNPIATNLALTYFIASAVNIPLNSTWTKYSGTTTLPLTHTPFGGSDGGPVRYVRPYIIVNYPSGTIPTYWGAFKIRKQQLTRDNGALTISGSLGIGTSSPVQKLHVVGNSRIDGIGAFGIVQSNWNSSIYGVEIGGVGNALWANGVSYIELNNNAYFDSGGWKYANTAASSRYEQGLGIHYWFTAASGTAGTALTWSERMRLDNNGNLGIGTSSPTGGGLHIYGNTGATAAVRLQSSNGRTFDIGSTGTSYGSANNLIIYDVTAASERMRLDSNGNIGIGTTSVSTKLAVEGGSVSTVNSTGTDVRYSFDIRTLVGGAIGFNNAAATNVYGVVTGSAYFGVAQSYPIVFTTNGSERMRIAAGGNVGIGTTSPAYKLDVSGTARVGDTFLITTGATADARLEVGSGRSGNGNSYIDLIGDATYTDYGLRLIRYDTGANAGSRLEHKGTGQFQLFAAEAASVTISTTSTERMRITSAGDLLVGRTSGGLDNTSGVTISQSSIGMQTEGNAAQIIMNRTTSDGTIVEIRRNNIAVGTISVTTTATAYNTTSDYRLKESIKPISAGLSRINSLKPSVYNWKSDGSNGEGFLAHELAEVVPLAVTGQKDAVNDDGSINPQSVDLSKVVPILVAAIQELTARIKILESR
jgi:hypothetical protein